MDWIVNNIATIIVAAAVVAVVVVIVLKMRSDKKHGKHSCGGNCAGCSLCQHHDETEQN